MIEALAAMEEAKNKSEEKEGKDRRRNRVCKYLKCLRVNLSFG